MRRLPRVVAACLVLGWVSVGPAWAEEPETSVSQEQAGLDKAEARAADLVDALAELKRASDFLAAQKSFQFDAVLGFDAVQSNGQKLEFGANRKVTVRRPDRARVEAENRNGGKATLIFDGETISIDLKGENAYVSVARPGTLDEALDYMIDDLGTPAPLADLMYSNFHAGVADRIVSGFVVGPSKIGKQQCFHLSVSTDDIDAQLWFREGDEPLPCRIVITYRTTEGSPQFWAHFINWDLAAETPDTLFAFTPPAGAELIPIGVAVESVQQTQEGQ